MSDDIFYYHTKFRKYTHLIPRTHAYLMYTVKDILQRFVLPQLNVAISKTSFPSVMLSCDIKYLQRIVLLLC